MRRLVISPRPSWTQRWMAAAAEAGTVESNRHRFLRLYVGALFIANAEYPAAATAPAEAPQAMEAAPTGSGGHGGGGGAGRLKDGGGGGGSSSPSLRGGGRGGGGGRNKRGRR